ncbi:alpha-mannosidase [Sporolactobacillus sp. Y61]|uniref:Alpha-mannosidase n=1 Tax=Sporolactobacillus sp. Y61 TaxID=3160863 RepID=A0AAU8IHH7_9BACL
MGQDFQQFLRKANQQLDYLHDYFYRGFANVEEAVIMEDTRDDKRRIPQHGEWAPVKIGDHWDGRDRYFWLKFSLSVPHLQDGQHYVLHMDLGRTGEGNNSGFEGLVFVNGHPRQAVDSNHEDAYFDHTFSNSQLDVNIKLWTGLEGGGVPVIQHYVLRALAVGIIPQSVVDCFDYLRNIVDVIQEMDDDEPLKYAYINLVKQIIKRFYWSNESTETIGATCNQALTIIHRFISQHAGEKKGYHITAVGHTHIDVAWLWRLRHTREKIARSFSTVLELMKEYPDYRFFQSTPQDYAFLAEDYPELYNQIKQRIAEGRWEANGATWLEPDTNIPSGESLTRQFLYGIDYFQSKFAARQNVLWLPDVFGYSAALPQILQGFDIPNFMTTKISWNDTNRMPHDTFYWRGIDGSKVLTHFITTVEANTDFYDPKQWRYTYNGEINPRTVLGTYHVYTDKDINNDLLLSYGYGDGGGGPTREEIKNIRIINELPGMPTIENGRVDNYFDQLNDRIAHTQEPVAIWDGELYLEYHRGTYTSQAKVKNWNRRAEYALRQLEIWYTAAHVQKGISYPAERIRKLWIILLRNQFHDILPGSAIKEVYEDTAKEFKQLFDGVRQLRQELDHQLTKKHENCLLFRNSLPWPVKQLVRLPKGVTNVEDVPTTTDGNQSYALVDVPALGSVAHATRGILPTESSNKTVRIDGNTLHTSYYDVIYRADGVFESIVDRQTHREWLARQQGGNVFTLYEDRPLDFDDWNIDADYPDKPKQLHAQHVELTTNNSLFADLSMDFSFGHSKMHQVIRFYAHSPRIDFITQVDWHEHQTLLRTAFNTTIQSDYARYDIQYGNVQRPTSDNTSWDQAKFETVAHKWADLSERDCGLALLNDCKYGYRIKGQQMSLTLLKSGIDPDPNADEGRHKFTYSLLPHEGDFLSGDVEKVSEELNDPLQIVTNASDDQLTALVNLSGEFPVALDTIKMSEDEKAVIIRLHDYSGTKNVITVQPQFRYVNVVQVKLDEQKKNIPVTEINHDKLQILMNPYQIATLRFDISN